MTTIVEVHAREILDSRGNPTVEVDVVLEKMVAGEGVTVGPILLGAAKPVHVLTPTSTVRRLVNMTALTAVSAVTRR